MLYQPIRFVSSSNADCCTTSCDPAQRDLREDHQSALEGTTASAFYESVVRGSSTSSHSIGATKARTRNQRSRITASKSKQFQCNAYTFLRAASEGDVKTVEDCLNAGIDVNTVDEFGWSALMCAAFPCQKAVIRLLMAWPNVNCTLRNRKGLTASDILLEQGHRFALPNHNRCDETTPKRRKEGVSREHCAACTVDVVDVKHRSSTVHQLNTQSVPGLAPVFGIPESNKGFKLLMKEGWSGQSGLGRNEEGKRYPVGTLLKRNRAGLGAQREKPRVTHFGPFDTAAVASTKCRSVESSKVITRRAQLKRRAKQVAFEKDFRRQFY